MSGNFIGQNKILPGVYVNFLSNKPLSIDMGQIGTVLLPLFLNYGDKGMCVEIAHGQDTTNVLGCRYEEIIPLREAMKNASKVIVYKVNKGIKAKAVLSGGVTLTAGKSGSRGNDIGVKITLLDEGKHNVATYLAGAIVDIQTIGAWSEWTANGWIVVSGSGSVEPVVTTLAGGVDEPIGESDYSDCLIEAKKLFFNTIGCVENADTYKEKVIAFVKEMREQEGKKIQGVVAKCVADYEGIISVYNGVELNGGEMLDACVVCAYVAGMAASAKVNESCTNHTYLGGVDIEKRMTKSEREEAVGAGHLLFDVDSAKRVYVIYDINTLVSYGDGTNEDFKKNRVMRVLDGINNDIVSIFESNYMGKTSNNVDGRSLLRGSLIEYFNELQNMNAITAFETDDIKVTQGQTSDSVVIEIYVAPVDSCEKFYISVNVQ